MGVHPEDKQDDSTGKDVEHPLRRTRNPHLVADMEPSVQKRKSSKIRRKLKFWWKWNNRNVKPWPSEWERYRLKTIWMGGMETKTIWTVKNERGISDNFKNGRGMGPVLQGGHMGDAGSCHSGEQFFLPTRCFNSIGIVLEPCLLQDYHDWKHMCSHEIDSCRPSPDQVLCLTLVTKTDVGEPD